VEGDVVYNRLNYSSFFMREQVDIGSLAFTFASVRAN
jgi:hypothetical protein